MKRVMVVTNSLTGGGAERSMNLVCNELVKRGWAISLVPINSGPADQVILNCEVFLIERKWKEGLFGTTKAMLRFLRTVHSWKPDVVILNCDLPELFGATLLLRVQLVVVEHVNHPWSTRVNLGRAVRRLLQMRKSIWVGVSSHFSIWPNKQSPDSVIQNQILFTSQRHSVKTKSRRTGKIKRLIFIGRLVPQKRPDWIIEIANVTRIPIEVIGEGELRTLMEKSAIERRLVVNFRGHLRDPWADLEDGDLLIVPSAFEGDGLVVVEAIQKNVPMLISDIPDFRRFGLPEANHCKDVESFINCINEFRSDISALLVPRNTSVRILNSRSPKVIGDNWVKLLDSI